MANDPESNLLWGKSLAQHADAAKGACRKCGYVGHLTFQCRNFVKLKPQQESILDVSSTSSDTDDETPLKTAAMNDLKRKKNMKQKQHKRHRPDKKSHSSDSEDDSRSSSSEEHREYKKKKKHKDSKKTHRHHHKKSKKHKHKEKVKEK